MGASRHLRGGKLAPLGLGFGRRAGLFFDPCGGKKNCPPNARAGSVRVCLVLDDCARVHDFSVISRKSHATILRGLISLSAAFSGDDAAPRGRSGSDLAVEAFYSSLLWLEPQR